MNELIAEARAQSDRIVGLDTRTKRAEFQGWFRDWLIRVEQGAARGGDFPDAELHTEVDPIAGNSFGPTGERGGDSDDVPDEQA